MKRDRKRISDRKLWLSETINRINPRQGWRKFRRHSEDDKPPEHDQRGNKTKQTKPAQDIKHKEVVRGDLHRRHK